MENITTFSCIHAQTNAWGIKQNVLNKCIDNNNNNQVFILMCCINTQVIIQPCIHVLDNSQISQLHPSTKNNSSE